MTDLILLIVLVSIVPSRMVIYYIVRHFDKQRRAQHTFCYCPKCGNELISSGSFMEDTDLVHFACTQCGHPRQWLFDAPAPILITGVIDAN